MRTIAWVLAAAALAGAQGVDDGPTYAVTVQLDGIWGPSWIEAAEKGLRRLEGVVSAKAQGFRSPEKFFYDLAVKETAAVTPAAVEAHVKKLFADYEYMDMTYQKLAGTVEKTAGGYTLTARSKQKFSLKPGGALEKLMAEGKTLLSVSGKAVQPEKGDPVIEVTEAVESKK